MLTIREIIEQAFRDAAASIRPRRRPPICPQLLSLAIREVERRLEVHEVFSEMVVPERHLEALAVRDLDNMLLGSASATLARTLVDKGLVKVRQEKQTEREFVRSVHRYRTSLRVVLVHDREEPKP